MKNTTYAWYEKLKKPSWASPRWLFGPVWTMLYGIIAVSYFSVLTTIAQGNAPLIIALPFVLNLIFNLAFTPIQFGLKNNKLASVDILLVLITLIWALVVIYPIIAWVAIINIPYLLWVSFATVLQLIITSLNRKK